MRGWYDTSANTEESKKHFSGLQTTPNQFLSLCVDSKVVRRMPIEQPPRIIPRPKLALWMFLRGLKLRDATQPLGVQAEQVRRYCLPFGDPLRVVPPAAVMTKIVQWTAGEVGPADFYESVGAAEVQP